MLGAGLFTVVNSLNSNGESQTTARGAENVPELILPDTDEAALNPNMLDVGYAYGLEADTLVVDFNRLTVLSAAADYLARSNAVPPAAELSSDVPKLADSLSDPLLALSRENQRTFAWMDDSPPAADSFQAQTLRLLSAYVKALHGEVTVAQALGTSYPGGEAAAKDALVADLMGTDVPSADRQVLDEILAGDDVRAAVLEMHAVRSLADTISPDVKELNFLRAGFAQASVPFRVGAGLEPAELVTMMKTRTEQGEFARLDSALATYAALAGIAVPTPAVDLRSDFVAAVKEYANALASPLSAEDEAALEDYAAQLGPQEKELLASIIGATARTESVVAMATAGLSLEERAMIISFFSKDGGEAPSDERWEEFRPLLGRINMAPMWQASVSLAATVESATGKYRTAHQAGGGAPAFTLPASAPVPQGSRLLIIGSMEAETFNEDTNLLIDFGGDDKYNAPVGGGQLFGGLYGNSYPPWGPGLAAYWNCWPTLYTGGVPLLPETTAPSYPGRGFTSIVVELYGDDVYDAPIPACQGSFGGAPAGTLSMHFDYGGDDTYVNPGTYGPSSSMGGGAGGFGILVDYAGRDTYTMKSFTEGGNVGSGMAGGIGFLLDIQGNDQYKGVYYGTPGGSFYGGSGNLLDLSGDDSYTAAQFYGMATGYMGSAFLYDATGADRYTDTTYGYGKGYSISNAAALFLDGAGFDTYSGGLYSPMSNSNTFFARAGGTIGEGIDAASGQAVKGQDLTLKFTGPTNRFIGAPTGVIPLRLSATNFGSQSAPAVQAAITIISREDDSALPPFRDGPFTVNFGAVAPGATATQTYYWNAPDFPTTRFMLASADLVAAGDAEPATNVDWIDFTMRKVRDIQLQSLSLSTSGKIVPGTAQTISTTLANYGNVETTFPVTVTVSAVAGTTAPPGYPYTVTNTVTLPPYSAVYDPANPATTTTTTFSWTSPGTAYQGDYLVRVSVPEDANYNDKCPSACSGLMAKQTTVQVLMIVDGRISAGKFVPMQDPDYFEGFEFKVLNAGTDLLTGYLNMTAYVPPLGAKFTQSVELSIAPDATTSVKMKVPSPKPKYDEAWLFNGTVWAAGEKANTLFDNAREYTIKFKQGIVFLDDLEQDTGAFSQTTVNGCYGGAMGKSTWERGTVTYKGGLGSTFQAFSGSNVWGTNLAGPYCNGAREDLYYRGLDLTTLLPPVRLEFMTAYNTASVYGGGFVSSSPAGANAWSSPAMTPGYPCTMYPYNPEYYPEDYGVPALCGTSPLTGGTRWVKRSIDLSDYAGQVVDIRFRWASYYCCFAGSYSGWFIDDLGLYGARRVNGDLELLRVDTTPGPAIEDVPGSIDFIVRNNGLAPINATATIKLTLGTTTKLMPTPSGSIIGLAGGAIGKISIPWTPTESKRYLATNVKVQPTNFLDPVESNNGLGSFYLDVYGAAVFDDLEGYTSCPPSCGGWTHTYSPTSGPAATVDEWELGVPLDYPASTKSGLKAWATDLDGPYELGRVGTYTGCCYGTARYYKLTTPTWTIPAGGYVDGDQYVFAFAHAYDLSKQLKSDYYGTKQNDIAYVYLRQDSSGRVAKPQAGVGTPYGTLDYGYCYEYVYYQSECGTPPGQFPYYYMGTVEGWSGKNLGWEGTIIPLKGDVMPGQTVSADFILWSNPRESYLGSPKAGWAIDDVGVLKLPRFDYDMTVTTVSPLVFNASANNTMSVLVKNLGKKDYTPGAINAAKLKLTVHLPTGPVEQSIALPEILHGKSSFVDFPFAAPPLFFGTAFATVEVTWALDEWSLNDKMAPQLMRFAWLLYESDFERSNGAWEATSGMGWRWAERNEPDNLQGDGSWWTGPQSSGSTGSLFGPKIPIAAPFKLKTVKFDGQFMFDGGPGAMVCPYNGFRLADKTTDQTIAIPGLSQMQVYWWWVNAYCGSYRPLAYSIDLTSYQNKVDPTFQPKFEAWTSYYAYEGYLSSNNKGMELDTVAIYGNPYDKNVQVAKFASPGSLVGPGEEAKVTVKITNGGINWPSTPVGVQFTTNDPTQSLNVIRAVSAVPFAQSKDVSATWRIPPSLDGKNVRLTAKLVQQGPTGAWVPLTDEFGADNSLDLVTSVVSIHDLGVTGTVTPSLEPYQKVSVVLRAVLENRGTLTEPGTKLTMKVLDESGAEVHEVQGISAISIPPSYSASSRVYEFVWTPTVAGHYRLVTTVDYAMDAFDAEPADNQDDAWFHSGVMAFRSGEDFDQPTAQWKAEGGEWSDKGFRNVLSSSAPEGDYVLRTNPNDATYESLAQYRYELGVDLAGAATPRLNIIHAYDLGPGDFVRVLASKDQGGSWAILTPLGGYDGDADEGYASRSDGWRTAEFDLSAYTGYTRIRFELVADDSSEGNGWQLDNVRVTAGGQTLASLGFESPAGAVVEAFDFESGDQGWTTDASSANIKDWAVGTPTAYIFKGHSGSKLWKTDLSGAYSFAQTGYKSLWSPEILLPTSKESLTLGWWQWYQIAYGMYYYDGSLMPGYSDAGIVKIAVDGGTPTVVAPKSGYPALVGTATGSPRGFTGTSDGWQYNEIDLTPYMGMKIRIQYYFAIPYGSSPNPWMRDYYVSGGPIGGWAIDDVVVHAKDVALRPDSTNARVGKMTVPLMSTYESNSATVELINEATSARSSSLAWSWNGPYGVVLGSGTKSVSLPAAAGTQPGVVATTIDLPSVEAPQSAVLKAVLTTTGDTQPLDDVKVIPASINEVVMKNDFDTKPSGWSGAWPCLQASPCAGWSHSGSYDEWHHATVPTGKTPSAAWSGDHVYSTDLLTTGTGQDSNVYYQGNYVGGEPCCTGSNQNLYSTTFQVPAQGAVLQLMHAMDSLVGPFGYVDGGTVYANGQVLNPVGGYPPGSYSTQQLCYYPIYQKCFYGTIPWTKAEFPLDNYKGQNVQLRFNFQSDYYSDVASGWTIDDLQVIAKPPVPGIDLGVAANPNFRIDPRYPFTYSAAVANFGTMSTPLTVLEAEFFRNGVFLSSTLANLASLKPGETRTIEFTLPAGPVAGLSVRLHLETPSGGMPDENPINDIAETSFDTYESLYLASFDDGRLPYQGSALPASEQFASKTMPSGLPSAPNGKALIAGLTGGKISTTRGCGATSPKAATGCGWFSLPPMVIPPGSVLEFDQFYKFAGSNDGAFVEYSTDGGFLWSTLDPDVGYPVVSCGAVSINSQRCWTGVSGSWRHAAVPLDEAVGQLAEVRFKYFRSTATPADAGWAVDNVVIRANAAQESAVYAPRFERGPLTNPTGPIEPVSSPNVFGTGIKENSNRTRGWDILVGPAVDISKMPDPQLSFEYWFAPEYGGSALVQVLDPAGNWVEIDRLPSATSSWSHKEYDLSGLGDSTQVRFIYRTMPYYESDAMPGLLIDDVLIGSLSGSLSRTDEVFVKNYLATDGGNFTVPVQLTNTGPFTNLYQLKVRGPDPFWTSEAVPTTLLLQPGERRTAAVKVLVPFGGEPGNYPVHILAESLYDPLQRAVLPVMMKLDVTDRPDWEIKNVNLMVAPLVNGVWTVPDAFPNHIVVTIENTGLKDSDEPPQVRFIEHVTKGGVTDARAFNTTYLEKRDPSIDIHIPFIVNTSWMPRKDVTALEVVVNPGGILPERSRVNNSVINPIVVTPRSLPELILSGDPGYSRKPHEQEPTVVGLNVRNTGSQSTELPVDLALLAGYEHAYLTSPVVDLKPSSTLRMFYSSDLEARIDGVIMEARPLQEGAPWARMTPTGGYTYGCILSMDCESAISGQTGGRQRELKFDLRPMVGPTQFRLVFAMDSHNGRTYDGFQLARVEIKYYNVMIKDFNFGKGAHTWESSHTWTYRAAAGSVTGAWIVPRDYQNPFTIGLRQIPQGGACPPCLGAGSTGFAEMDWTPTFGGDVPLIIYLDPHDLQPEFVDDFNRFEFVQKVLTSDFEATPTEPITLSNATATRTAGLRMTNHGNHDGSFRVDVRDSTHFTASLSQLGRVVSEVSLGAGQSTVIDLNLQGKGAPAGLHSIYLDVTDMSTGKAFPVALPITVKSGVILPTLDGDTEFTIRQKAAQTVMVKNLGNAPLEVVLRVVDKPSGLAARITPSEFSLAPFEARSVEFELINLGAQAGTYSVGLINAKVVCPTDDPGCNRMTPLKAIVLPYAPPRASINLAKSSAGLGEAVSFKDASSTTGSTIVSWKWDFGDGTSSLEQSPVHTYARPGVYQVRLKVTDSEGQVVESPPSLLAVVNKEPVTVDRYFFAGSELGAKPRAGMPVNFTAADSTDVDGGIRAVTWAFGDGLIAQGLNVSHAYAKAGTYRVTVAVEDSFGAVSVQVMEITVEAFVDPAARLASEEEGGKSPAPSVWTLLAALAFVAGGLEARRRRRRDGA